MNILIFGTGVIGCTYGYAFKQMGAKVSHFIRTEKRQKYPRTISISLLDGREKEITRKCDLYTIEQTSDFLFDLILLSVPNYQLKESMEDLTRSNIEGPILLFCNIWEDKVSIEYMMKGKNYILGFPVAGGSFQKNHSELNCVLFRILYLEKKKNTKSLNYKLIAAFFHSCSFSIETPYDMLQWIWIHIAINIGLLNSIIYNGGIENSEIAVKKVISSSKELKRAIKEIRICMKIVKKRGVKFKYFIDEIILFYLPAMISVPIIKNIFKNNILTREIILLHNNKNDLLYQRQELVETGKKNNIFLGQKNII